MSKKIFVASEDQKKDVFKRLCEGELAPGIRLDIINPETQKPIDLDTFCREFAEEIINARAINGGKVTSNLLKAATYEGVNKVTGLIDRNTQAMKDWLNLNGRGLFGKKFVLDTSKTLHEQINQVKQACADGYIGTQEMTGFVDAICKEANIIEFADLKKEVEELKRLHGAKP